MMPNQPKLEVVFFKSQSGREPVREWLRSLQQTDKKIIGEDVKTVQYGWPLGMPVVRKLEPNLWEIRSNLPHGTARIIFTTHENWIILLHGFIKKSQRTPTEDLRTARERLALVQGRKN